MSKETSNTFWKNKTKYPNYDAFIKQRRLYEINYLLPRLKGESLLDLGCGNGALLECLLHLTNLKLYGYDLSENLLKNINPLIETKVYDCYNLEPLPKTDITVFASVIVYLFDDVIIDKVLSLINSNTLFLRAPCTLKDEDELINTFSKQLQEKYSARYMIVPHVLNLLDKHFIVEDITRIFPDEIESKYGTKQFYFKGVKR